MNENEEDEKSLENEENEESRGTNEGQDVNVKCPPETVI